MFSGVSSDTLGAAPTVTMGPAVRTKLEQFRSFVVTIRARRQHRNIYSHLPSWDYEVKQDSQRGEEQICGNKGNKHRKKGLQGLEFTEFLAWISHLQFPKLPQ